MRVFPNREPALRRSLGLNLQCFARRRKLIGGNQALVEARRYGSNPITIKMRMDSKEKTSDALWLASRFADRSWLHRRGNNECPVGVLPGSPGDPDTGEFGPGTQELTRCLSRRHKVKVVVQINQFCRDTWNKAGDRVRKITDCAAGRAYALGNIKDMLNDYEITHGMRPDKDFEVVAVVHTTAGVTAIADLQSKGYTYVQP